MPDLKLLSRVELGEAERHARRAAVRPALAWSISGALLLLVGNGFARGLAERVGPALGETWLPFLVPALQAPGIAVGLWAFAVWGRLTRISRPCPRCSMAIAPRDFASITGRCSHCGEVAIDDPFPGMSPLPNDEPRPSWTVPEFSQLAERRRKRLWIGCFLGAGLACLWIAPFLVACRSERDVSHSPAMWTAYFICMIGMMVVQCGGAWLWQRYSERGLHCRECDGELLFFYRLVVSSSRCYHCGSAVLGTCAETSRGPVAH